MTSKLPKNASVAVSDDGAKLHAPSAARNADALCNLLVGHAPQSGQALEIASGTGQHIVQFAKARPGLVWQPTDLDPVRLASIDAHALESGLTNVKPAQRLEATRPGWHLDWPRLDLICLVNLLHLIGRAPAQTLVTEALAALHPAGRFILYGPFSRDGVLTSAGDIRFDSDLRSADPKIGYKDNRDVARWLQDAGATHVRQIEMPANNLAFVATKR